MSLFETVLIMGNVQLEQSQDLREIIKPFK